MDLVNVTTVHFKSIAILYSQHTKNSLKLAHILAKNQFLKFYKKTKPWFKT